LDDVTYRSIILPPKWAADLIETYPLPGEFLEFILKKTSSWDAPDQDSAKYLVDWALEACGAVNISGDKGASQLGLTITDFDKKMMILMIGQRLNWFKILALGK